ncbi:hydrolase activity, hydrolyzing O-glycosyl compounds protein [[Candida] boidinii]|nr:hydrolase activity, hydrolyzing O-glycosyl compounds protein [[Candida] boidinii]
MLFKNILNTIAITLMAGSAIAQPINHKHHMHEKRGVVVVTETVVVTAHVGNAGESVQTINYVHADTSVSTTATAAAAVVPTTVTSAAAVETTSAATAAAETSAAASSDDSSSDDTAYTSGTKGVTYSPYAASGACKSLDEVKSDFASLTGYGIIRLYGSDCNQVANVLQAKSSSQKLFLGVYYVNDISGEIGNIVSAINAYGSWDDVITVSIGNELVNSGQATVSQVAGYVSTGRSLLTSAGYSGKVTSVDTHVAIINNPGLCEISDYITFNAHAYWDGNVYPDGAGAWLLLQMQRVWSACGGKKDVFCAESGWPHAGDANGICVPSVENQKTALASIASSCGNDVVAFEAYDSLWKSGTERYWGIY